MEKFDVTGMTCAACSAHVERAVRGVEGVKEVAVSLLTNSMTVDFSSPATAEKICAAESAAGYGASPQNQGGKKESKKTLLESNEPKKPWCVDDYVDFIGTFCKKLGIVPTVVLGHSFGGRVIIKAVTREKPVLNPEKIILTDSAGIKPKQSVSSKIKTRTYKMGKAVMSTAPMKKLFPDAVENMRNKRGSADYLAASPVMRATLVKVVNEDLTYLLPEIKQSTLLIWGDKDDATPLSDGVKMSELIKDSGLVTIEGEDYQIVDIGLRMLEPKELYGCQGFPDDYIIDHDCTGKTYPRSEQVRRCGNAVCPPLPAALVKANLPEMCIAKRQPNLRIDDSQAQLRFA